MCPGRNPTTNTIQGLGMLPDLGTGTCRTCRCMHGHASHPRGMWKFSCYRESLFWRQTENGRRQIEPLPGRPSWPGQVSYKEFLSWLKEGEVVARDSAAAQRLVSGMSIDKWDEQCDALFIDLECPWFILCSIENASLYNEQG